MIKMTEKGAGAVVSQLRHIGDRVVDSARKMMHRSADRVVEEAKINAPVDLINLEQTIHKEVGYGGKGRLMIDVVAGGEINGVNVDDYVALIHENYEDIISEEEKDIQGNIRRLNTKRKQRAHPDNFIGSKFLERAFEKETAKLNDRLVNVVTKVIEENQ